MLTASRFLNPKADIVFKKIFGNHANIFKSFFNALIHLPERSVIEQIEYLPSEQVPTIPEPKRTIGCLLVLKKTLFEIYTRVHY